jgi:hypothetical protein
MQGIETLGYEVVETTPVEAMFSEGGIAQHQQAAEMLAEFGRNGDTYVVHAAEGETVIPLEVLENNPRLKNMIFTQMEEMGLEPERYVVGNELNSLNPDTGQPEFFFKFLKKVVKKVVNVVKKIAPVVLAIAAPILLPAMPVALAAGIGSTAGNLIQGKNLGDSLKSGVVSGLTAGAGNMIAGGSFLGSAIDPSASQGIQDLGTMFTPDNPFTAAASSTLTELGTEVTAAATANPEVMAPRGLLSDSLTGKETTSEAIQIADDLAAGKATSFTQGLKNAFTVGDGYGFDDFWSQYLSPGRESISAAAKDGYQNDLALYESSDPLTRGTLADYVSALDDKYAPGLIEKYAPVVATAIGAGAISDEVLGTEFITAKEQAGTDIASMQNAGADLLASDYDKYGIDDSYVKNNPYYPNYGGDQVTTQTSSVNPGFTNPVAPIAPVTSEVAGLASIPAAPLPAAVRSDPNAENQYAGMLGGGYFNQTPYSNIQYAQPPMYNAPVYDPPIYPLQVASGGEINGPGTPTSDSVPAMLSDGEFVMNARAVRGAGGGDRQQGAKRMYEMMRSFERTA